MFFFGVDWWCWGRLSYGGKGRAGGVSIDEVLFDFVFFWGKERLLSSGMQLETSGGLSRMLWFALWDFSAFMRLGPKSLVMNTACAGGSSKTGSTQSYLSETDLLVMYLEFETEEFEVLYVLFYSLSCGLDCCLSLGTASLVLLLGYIIELQISDGHDFWMISFGRAVNSGVSCLRGWKRIFWASRHVGSHNFGLSVVWDAIEDPSALTQFAAARLQQQ